MNVATYLQSKNVPFETMRHAPAFTAQELAAAAHLPGDLVAKVVVVRVDAEFKLLVLPASYSVRFDLLRQIFGTDKLRLATEQELAELFDDCELGAMPPFGRPYGLESYVDEHLAEDDEIIFQSCSHLEAVRVRWDDYCEIEEPKVAAFAEHLH